MFYQRRKVGIVAKSRINHISRQKVTHKNGQIILTIGDRRKKVKQVGKILVDRDGNRYKIIG